MRKKLEKKSWLQLGLSLWPRDTQPTELWSKWCWELVNYMYICSHERDECDGCHIKPRKWNQTKNYPRSCERNLCNCVRSLKKFRTSTGFEPVTLVRCSNWAMKPLMLGAGQLNDHMFPWKTSFSRSQGSCKRWLGQFLSPSKMANHTLKQMPSKAKTVFCPFLDAM